MSSAVRIIISTVVVFGILRVSDNPSNREIAEWIMVGFALFILYLTDKRKMMKIYTEKNVTYKILDHLTCDICGHEIKTDSMEFQEHINIKKDFGYGSNCFGDNTSIDIDFCEKCMYDIIQEKGLAHLIEEKEFIEDATVTPIKEVKLAKGSKF